ncbi:MAG: hypothetical protein D8M51_00185 [Ignavibacteriae bacterium]|nr:hypothetical protein [Ignavibacteriota bacterium]
MLFDEPISGQSRYGSYWMYTLKDRNGEEVLYFAPEEVNEQIKSLKKGDRFEITKYAEQKGTKIVTRYDIKVERKNLESPANELNKSNGGDYFYDLMLASCRDAVKIQNELGGLMDAKSLAVTLFIARSKINGNSLQ